jgi:hypothetical protein
MHSEEKYDYGDSQKVDDSQIVSAVQSVPFTPAETNTTPAPIQQVMAVIERRKSIIQISKLNTSLEKRNSTGDDMEGALDFNKFKSRKTVKDYDD